MLRRIDGGELVIEQCFVSSDAESMGHPGRQVKCVGLHAAKVYREVFSVRRRSFAKIDGDIEGIAPQTEYNLIVCHGRKLKVKAAHAPRQRIGGILLGEIDLQAEVLPEWPVKDLGKKSAGVARNCGAKLKAPWNQGFDDSDFRAYETIFVYTGWIAC
jgi:hypothetical protein